MLVRPATDADVPAVTAIYNAGIEAGGATFETRLRSEDEVARWLGDPLPFLVAEDAGRVVGWARCTPYSDREAYATIAEHNVYVDPGVRGRGIGRRLLDALAAAAEAAGVHKLTSRVFTTNAASLAAHRAAGFDVIGVKRRHGRVDGRWVDVAVVERLLGEAAHTHFDDPALG